MDFPPTWVVLPAEDYELATPRIEGELTAEVMAQVRRSGRILDHFKIVIGGSKQLEVDIDLHALMPLGDFKGWRMTGQFWPRDLAFRQNTFSTAWIDAIVTIGMREVKTFDHNGAEIRRERSSASWRPQPRKRGAQREPASDGRWWQQRTISSGCNSRASLDKRSSYPEKRY